MNTSIAKSEKSDAIHNTSRTALLLVLMTKGDDAFNDRDQATLDVIHHPDMIAYVKLKPAVTGLRLQLGNRKRHSHCKTKNGLFHA